MIYVDPIRRYRSGLWCHMMTDQDDLTELHTMAARIGLTRAYFQDHPLHPHYDLRREKRSFAIANGATPVSSEELIKRCSKLIKNRIAKRG